MKVLAIRKAVLACINPPVGVGTLALGAVPVATGVISNPFKGAITTPLYMSTQGLCSAFQQGTEYFAVIFEWIADKGKAFAIHP